MAKSRISRREFMQMAGVATGAAVLGACAPQVVRETQVVTQVVAQTQQVVQTQLVNQTQIVEQIVEVTPTPLPDVVTPQGKVMPADAAPLDQQVYRGVGGELKHWDPARDIYNGMGTNLSTEPYLRNNEHLELVPALCESWTPGPNAEYWDFVIRDGAVWSDGTPITADDVLYTFRHIADPALANPWIWFYFDIKGIVAAATGAGSLDDIGVEKVDDRTARIYGEAGPIAYLPQMLAYQASVLAPKHKAEADPEHWADTIENFVSSGPYIPTVWEHGVRIQFDINPLYNGPHKPSIQKHDYPIFAAGANSFTAWLNQEIDLLHILQPQDLAFARSDPKLNPLIHFFPNFQSTYVALDVRTPPLDNQDFRKALAHSIDRQAMCQGPLGGTYVPGYSMLPPGFPAYNPDLADYQIFDLERAQESLTASGIDPATVTIELYSNARDVFLEFVQEQWQTNLGITVNLNVLEGGVWGAERAAHNMQAYRGPYEYDYVDPSNMLTGLWRSTPAPEGQEEPWGSPRHSWKNDEFDQLVTAAGGEGDIETRLQMYRDAETLLVDEVGAVFLAHQVVFQIWWPWLVGMHPDRNGNVVYRWLDIAFSQMYIRNDVDDLKANYY